MGFNEKLRLKFMPLRFTFFSIFKALFSLLLLSTKALHTRWMEKYFRVFCIFALGYSKIYLEVKHLLENAQLIKNNYMPCQNFGLSLVFELCNVYRQDETKTLFTQQNRALCERKWRRCLPFWPPCGSGPKVAPYMCIPR